ncbi:hypothetical protein CONPUDRAFT_88466 [Coniophora puteana RWD-64-598 SS2]|uniref:Uncharacterized protein n=1 Tax=Coniophora puteana (strain RWD-64-598) TaxID=741705 RepID=A0A5M3MZB4_CONPW|nr:uncharacterized protein CONPUDRAFT_88466 [Coniophora puteana RWD-64-598 SS2]EIW84144.1 hypothetical protein CONPUDRAFT_88466 [Coniophora puteana RWD-64-598 SS2]
MELDGYLGQHLVSKLGAPDENSGESQRAYVEEVPDGDDEPTPVISEMRWCQDYNQVNTDADAGYAYKQVPTLFEQIRDVQDAKKMSVYGPFADEDDWELARWLWDNCTQSGADKLLKMKITQQRTRPSFGSTYTWLKKIDQLPTGPDWTCKHMLVNGDGDVSEDLNSSNEQVGDGGDETERLELWMRDPVQAVRKLIGNPHFRESMAYAPEHVYTDMDMTNRRIDEMWTADWWWETQSKIERKGTVGAIILSTDKTQLSLFRGDKQAYPVYITLGNIAKGVRRQPSKHASVVIGYLPVSKLKSFENSAVASYRLFHFCMGEILRPLVEAGRGGIFMLCADGFLRRVFPILAAYIADHPEQCLVACCAQNCCPRCLVDVDRRGEEARSANRSHNKANTPPTFIADGLHPIFSPFWASLPYTNIFRCISSDVLHQLHQGVFKDHLLKWCSAAVDEDTDLDEHFQVMPPYAGLRQFKDGISRIRQWTGGEHKQVQRVFVAAVAGSVDRHVLIPTRALLDFITLAQYYSHTTNTLSRMEEALRTFHKYKDEFLKHYDHDHFNIPKLHSLLHYLEMILALGSLDGLNSENTERLHIDYAKRAYRATNKKDYIVQMARWLQRSEALAWWPQYLEWRLPPSGTDASEDEDVDPADVKSDPSSALMLPSIHTRPNPSPSPLPRPSRNSDDLLQEATSANLDASAAAGFVVRSPTVAIRVPHRNIPVSMIIKDHGAVGFTEALIAFLENNNALRPSFHPNQYDVYDLFNGAVVHLPPEPYLNVSKLDVCIRATPAKWNGSRKREAPARWDTVLVEVDHAQHAKHGGLHGLRVAEVQVIFSLPEHLGHVKEPLAYVQWFREVRLSNLDRDSGMFKLSRASRRGSPHTECVPLSRIIHPCHLVPCFGRTAVPSAWLCGRVLELAPHFLLNRYIDTAMYEDYVQF